MCEKYEKVLIFFNIYVFVYHRTVTHTTSFLLLSPRIRLMKEHCPFLNIDVTDNRSLRYRERLLFPYHRFIQNSDVPN